MERSWQVLIVDDDADFLYSAKRLLGASGRLNIHTAASAFEGLEVLRAHTLDLVIADYKIGPDDGATFLRRVHEMRPDVRSVFLTGYDVEYLVQKGLAPEHADIVLSKTAEPGMLQRTVAQLLRPDPSDGGVSGTV